MAELIEEFNNFGGASIKTHKQKFACYSKKLNQLDNNQRDHVFSNIKTFHRQEEIFLTKLLLQFGYTERLKNIILSGDIILSKIVLDHKPFAFKDKNVSFFTQDIFPHVSFVVRLKCINNLSHSIKDEFIGREYFSFIFNNYGVKLAIPFLLVCDEKFIRTTITDYRILLKERYLITLHKKFGVDFLEYYFKQCLANGIKTPFSDKGCLAYYLVHNDIQTLDKLFQFGVPRIGKQGAIKYVNTYKNKVIKDPSFFEGFIRPKLVYKQLTREEFAEYFMNTFPKKVENLDLYQVTETLKLLPPNDRGKFFTDLFFKKYGFKAQNILKIDTNNQLPTLLSTISLSDRLGFELNEDEMMEYNAPAVSFCQIKEKINITSDIPTRGNLILKLFKSAKHNNDMNALNDALKYVLHRHKNDKSSMRRDIANFMHSNYKLATLGAETWKYLEELIQIDETLSGYSFYMQPLVKARLYYKFLNNTATKDLLVKYHKFTGTYLYKLPTKDKKFHKWFMDNYLEAAAEAFTEEYDLENYPCAFFSLIRLWNNENPNEIIKYNSYSQYMENVIENYDNYFYNDKVIFHILTEKLNDDELRKKQEEVRTQFKKFIKYDRLWLWFLKYEPEFIESNLDLLFNKEARLSKEFFYELHKIHYLDLRNKIYTKALEILKEDNCDDPLLTALDILSFEKNFLDLINSEKFYPNSEATIDVFEENVKSIVKLHNRVLKCFRNSYFASNVINAVLRFCYKDYMEKALGTLSFIVAYCTPTDVKNILNALKERSVTVRKHALFFQTVVGTAEEVYDALEFAGKNETNVSLQKFTLAQSFTALCNLSTQRFFDLLLKHFKFLFEKDAETQSLLLKVHLVPKEFITIYIEKIWFDFAKNFGNDRSLVIKALTENIMPFISDKILDEIVQSILSDKKMSSTNENIKFIYKYLTRDTKKLDDRVDNVVQAIANLNCDNAETTTFNNMVEKMVNTKTIYTSLYKEILENTKDDKQIIQTLLEKFILECAKISTSFNAIKFMFEIGKNHLQGEDSVVHYVIKLQKDVVHQFGDKFLEYFNNFISEQLNLILKDDNDSWIQLNEKLLNLDSSENTKLLIVKLLPQRIPQNEKIAQQYRDLINRLANDPSSITQIYLDNKLTTVILN